MNSRLKKLLINVLRDYSDKLAITSNSDWIRPDYLSEEDQFNLMDAIDMNGFNKLYPYDYMIPLALAKYIEDNI